MLVGVTTRSPATRCSTRATHLTHAVRFDDARVTWRGPAVPRRLQGWFPDLVRVNRALSRHLHPAEAGRRTRRRGAGRGLEGLRFRMDAGDHRHALGLHRAA